MVLLYILTRDSGLWIFHTNLALSLLCSVCFTRWSVWRWLSMMHLLWLLWDCVQQSMYMHTFPAGEGGGCVAAGVTPRQPSGKTRIQLGRKRRDSDQETYTYPELLESRHKEGLTGVMRRGIPLERGWNSPISVCSETTRTQRQTVRLRTSAPHYSNISSFKVTIESRYNMAGGVSQ